MPSLQWNFTNQFGDPVYPNSGVWISRLDSWLIMYGLKSFSSFFENTNLELLKRGRSAFKYMAETLRFQGVARLVTRFGFRKRDEIWSTVVRKYMPTAKFGNSGMVHDIFKEIFSAHRYSKQLPFRPSNISSE